MIMKRILWIFTLTTILSACETGDGKQTQAIDFGEIAPQQLQDGFLLLRATASSGLPVFFESQDSSIVVINGNKAEFLQTGLANITACQPGNEQFYEAPQIKRQLRIRDWDPSKKTQEISFDLPAEWKLSRDYQIVPLEASASSGLPVNFTLSSTKYGHILSSNKLYLYHAGEGGTRYDIAYDVNITVTASQAGNEEYNPADNVANTIHVIGDVFH
jgi:hypothetical protein